MENEAEPRPHGPAFGLIFCCFAPRESLFCKKKIEFDPTPFAQTVFHMTLTSDGGID
jgi:hypothetical protein